MPGDRIESGEPRERDSMSWSQMWQICGRIFHAGDYRARHARVLSDAIGDPRARILDTACGVGFPLLDLVELGYERLTGADVDAVLLAELRLELARRGLSLPLVQTAWQDIAETITGVFDVVLNVDASITLMDSWSASAMVRGERAMFRRVTSVLEQFCRLVAAGGALIIGLQKNNQRFRDALVVDVGRVDIDGREAALVWELDYDWEARVKTWTSVLAIGSERHERVVPMYLFDKRELGDMLRAAGFETVTELDTPAPIYEDLLVARKS